jgi:hypothetical protein
MVCSSIIQDATLDISSPKQPNAKTLRHLDEGQGKKNGLLVSRWVRDENSKLYCQWFFE